MTIKMTSRNHDFPPGRVIPEETVVRLKKGDPSVLIPHDDNIPATPKVLAVDPQKCNGCKLCEIACSLFHDGEVDPARSRIHVLEWNLKGIFLPFYASIAPMRLAGQHARKMPYPGRMIGEG